MRKQINFKVKETADIVKAEIGEDKNKRMIITLILSEDLQEKYLMHEGESKGNFKCIVSRVEVATEKL